VTAKLTRSSAKVRSTIRMPLDIEQVFAIGFRS